MLPVELYIAVRSLALTLRCRWLYLEMHEFQVFVERLGSEVEDSVKMKV